MELQAKPFGISDRIDELNNNLAEMEEAKFHGAQEVELSRVNFVTPLSILPLAVYANNNDLTIKCTDHVNYDPCSYLDTIGFQFGVTEFTKIDKRYLPITKLSTKEDNALLSQYEEKILAQTHVERVVLKHLTSELVNNVNEHAQVDQYWLLAQYYKGSRPIVEIVLADCGIGYKNSYMGTSFEVTNDTDAIINALEGRSSKTELNGRGFGIPSLVKIFVNELGGKLIIMSGNSLVYYKPEEKKELKLKSYWQGALIGINFGPKAINIYKCL
jgi:hypothetical protein